MSDILIVISKDAGTKLSGAKGSDPKRIYYGI